MLRKLGRLRMLVIVTVGLTNTGIYKTTRADCSNEPPPVQNSYRKFSDNYVQYTCRENGSVMDGDIHRKTCLSNYELDEFRFCSYSCGSVYPPEAGARRARVAVTGQDGKTVTADSDYYECIDGYTTTAERGASSYSHPTCDRSTQTYRQPLIGCFLQGVNFVNGSTPSYIKLTTTGKPDQTDGQNTSNATATVSSSRPLQEWKLNAIDLIEVTDIILTASYVGVVNLTVIAGNNSESFCEKITNWLPNTVHSFRCSLTGGAFPKGSAVRLTLYGFTQVTDVQVLGRPYINSCPPPPPLHGMVVHNYNFTHAVYRCTSDWHKLSGNGRAACNLERKWEVPNLACTDQINLGIKYDTHSTGLLQMFPVAIDGNDNSCTHNFLCTQTNNRGIYFKSPIEVHHFVLIYKWERPTQANITISVGVNVCEQLDTYDINMISFKCTNRPISNHVTVYYTAPESSSVNASGNLSCVLCEVKIFGRELDNDGSSLECFQEKFGRDYKGRAKFTVSGRVCQSWSVQDPHSHDYDNDEYFADELLVSSEENYCRHPVKLNGTGNSQATRPWCFTTDPDTVWEECGVPPCSEICSLRKDGADYAGYISETKKGRACVFWPDGTSEDPNDHRDFTFVQDFPDWQIRLPYKHNSCRNPASSQSGPWCYTDKTGLSELCEIPECPVSTDNFQAVQISLDEVKKKLEPVKFSFGFVWLHKFQIWETYTKKALVSAQICPKDNVHLLIVEYGNNNEKYVSLFVICIDSPSNKDTSLIAASRTASEEADISAADYNASSGVDASACVQATPGFTDGCYSITPSSTVNTEVTETAATPNFGGSLFFFEVSSAAETTNNRSEFPRKASPQLLLYNNLTDETTSSNTPESSDVDIGYTTVKMKYRAAPSPPTTSNSTIVDGEPPSEDKFMYLTCLSAQKNIRCWCPCNCSVSGMHAVSEGSSLIDYKRDIREQLIIDPVSLSRHTRTKQSALDHRQTSAGAGIIAVLFVLAAIAGVAFYDFLRLLRHVLKKKKM